MPEVVFWRGILALVIQHENRILSAQHYIAICGLSGFSIFFTLSHKWHDFQNIVVEHKMCVLIFSTIRYSCQILMKLEFSEQIFKKSSSVKFCENPSSGSQVVPCRQTEEWTDRYDKLMVAFRNFVNTPKKNRTPVFHYIHNTATHKCNNEM
jgi:hypothetical protein